MLAMTLALAGSVVFSQNFENKTEGWDLRESKVIAETGNRFVRITAKPGMPHWAVTPPVKAMTPAHTYTITARLRGKGTLWLHAWNNDKQGKGDDPIGITQDGRDINISHNIDCEDWKVVGIRRGVVYNEVGTIRICFEPTGGSDLDIDDVVITEDDAQQGHRPELTCAFDRNEIVLGDSAVVRASGDALKGSERYAFNFITKWNVASHVFEETTDGQRGIFITRPTYPGTFKLRVVREDDLGPIVTRDLQLVVLPAARPPAVRPTLDTQLSLRVAADCTIASASDKLVVRPRLGFPEYLPVTVINDGPRETLVTLRARDANRDVDAAFVSPVSVCVKSGANASFSLPVRTFLNVPHELTLEVKAPHGKLVCVPLAFDPIETYPLFGTQEQFNRDPPGRDVALRDMRYLRELPCQLFRLPDVMQWANAGKYADADFAVDGLLNEGCTQVHPFLGYVPKEFKPLDENFEPAKSAAFRKYVEGFAARYIGRVRYWEAFNEPPWGSFTNYEKNGGKVLVTLQRHLWEAVKSRDPKAKLVAPGWCRYADFPVIEDYIKLGGDQYTDVYNMHEYTLTWRNWYGRTEREAAFEYSRWADQAVIDGQTIKVLDILRKHGINKPLFVTECGGNLEATSELKRRMKAILFLRSNFIWLAAGIAGIQHYEFFDYSHESLPSQFGLMRARLGEKLPFFWAYREEIFALTGAKPVAPMVVDGTSKRVDFVRGNERIMVGWNCGREAKSVSLPTYSAVYETEQVVLDPFADQFITRKFVRGAFDGQLTIPPASIVITISRLAE